MLKCQWLGVVLKCLVALDMGRGLLVQHIDKNNLAYYELCFASPPIRRNSNGSSTRASTKK